MLFRLFYTHPGFVKPNLFHRLVEIQDGRPPYLESNCRRRHCVNYGELRTVGLPSEFMLAGGSLRALKVPVLVYGPLVFARNESPRFRLEKRELKGVDVSYQYSGTETGVLVYRDIDALVPDIKNSGSRSLGIFVRVGDSVGIIRRVPPGNDPDRSRLMWRIGLDAFNGPCPFVEHHVGEPKRTGQVVALHALGENISPIFSGDVGLADREVVYNPLADLIDQRLGEFAERVNVRLPAFLRVSQPRLLHGASP